MPKHARVAILMIAIVIFAVAMLDLVRSKVEASSQSLKTAALQYSSLKKIYAPSVLVHPLTGAGAESNANTR
jgi:hypothetical protein